MKNGAMKDGKGRAFAARIGVRELCVTAAMVAIALVLHRVRLFPMPQGGAVTACSMVFVALPGWLFGAAVGGFGGIAFGLAEFILDGYVFHPGSFFFDYVFAFGALGAAAGFFDRLWIGYIFACTARFASSFISGWLFFASYASDSAFSGRVPSALLPVIYSAWYNLSYIAPEAAATLVVISLPTVKRALLRVKGELKAG